MRIPWRLGVYQALLQPARSCIRTKFGTAVESRSADWIVAAGPAWQDSCLGVSQIHFGCPCRACSTNVWPPLESRASLAGVEISQQYQKRYWRRSAACHECPAFSLSERPVSESGDRCVGLLRAVFCHPPRLLLFLLRSRLHRQRQPPPRESVASNIQSAPAGIIQFPILN
jgi:hypothetical protein